MKTHTLIAGVGNVFLGDDAFGVEVIDALPRASLPQGVVAVDFGIRGVHLAFELLKPYERLLIVDAVARGEAPGTIFLLAPEPGREAGAADGHSMSLPHVFSSLLSMGGRLPRTLVLGCEPERLEEGIGLSPSVRAAVPVAVARILEIVREKWPPAAKERSRWEEAWGGDGGADPVGGGTSFSGPPSSGYSSRRS